MVEPETTGLAEAETVSAALAQASQAIARSRVELEEKVDAATNRRATPRSSCRRASASRRSAS